MQITRQADYAVRAVLYLAFLKPETRVSTAQIAEAQDVPHTFLAKIMSQLSTAGIVRAARGVRGGVSLAKPAADISLLEVVQAIDGPVSLIACQTDPGRCSRGTYCVVRDIWNETQAEWIESLKQIRFDQLAQREQTRHKT